MNKSKLKAILYLLLLAGIVSCGVWSLYSFLFFSSEKYVENALCMPTHYQSKLDLIQVRGTEHYVAETIKRPPKDVAFYYASLLDPQPYTGVWTSNEIGIWEVGDIPAEVDSSGQLFQCKNKLEIDFFDGPMRESGCIWIREWEDKHTLIEYSWRISPVYRPCYSEIRSFKNTPSDSN